MMKSSIIYHIIFYFCFHLSTVFGAPKKIAIIGGGIGGTSCAKYLNEYLGDNIMIDIYESNEIGGRLSGITYKGHYYEIGASTIGFKDKYATELVSKFGLLKKSVKGSFSVYKNGQLTRVSVFKAITLIPSVVKNISFNERMRKQLESIYSDQSNYSVFKSVSQMFDPINEICRNNLLTNLKAWKLTNEMLEQVELGIRADYGQNLEIPAVAGFISIIKNGFSGGYSIVGGNQKIAQGCFNASNAKRIPKNVIGLTRSSDHKSKVKWMNKNGKEVTGMKEYDFAIVAVPLAENLPKFEFLNYGKSIKMNAGNFIKTVITILEGKLKPNFFFGSDSKKKVDIIPKGIVFIDDAVIDYIFKLEPANGNIWKIQSRRILTEEEKKSIFENHVVAEEKEWLAYPDYKSHMTDNNNDTFELADNLLYLNSMEWGAASSIETSLISAKNAALFIRNAVSENNQ